MISIVCPRCYNRALTIILLDFVICDFDIITSKLLRERCACSHVHMISRHPCGLTTTTNGF